MGLSHYPTAADGMVPAVLMTTLTLVQWVMKLMDCVEHAASQFDFVPHSVDHGRSRRISITQFRSLLDKNEGTSGDGGAGVECCVCLHGFEDDEQVSELACKHFFHKRCLQKWLDHDHATCPLCRSTF